jgi:PUA domain protein
VKRHYLSKKDKEQVAQTLKEKLGITSIPEIVELMEDEEKRCYLFEGTPSICEVGGNTIPLLKWLIKHRGEELGISRIIVNKGAVKPISGGADLMAPGIVRIEGTFPAGTVIVVAEEERGIPIAVMRAIFSSDEIKGMKRGKVAENLHWVGDKLWKEL